jgi:hypothetical protein
VTNGGTTIAMITTDNVPGVIVRETTTAGGRIVHVNHTALYTSRWMTDGSPMMKLFANSLKWASHCL